MKLQGKTALVTGSGRNIGRAIALAFAREGANVVVNARSNIQEIEQVAQEARAYGVQALPVRADVSDAGQVDALMARAHETFGAVDILVNNAAVRPKVLFPDMTYEDWRRVLGVALDGAFLCVKGVLPKMLERRWGRIINIGSIAAIEGGVGGAHHIAAKNALRGLTRALAKELGPQGVLVNDVAPGIIDTWLTASVQAGKTSKSDLESYVRAIPIGRLGRPEDIAGVCVFLASDAGGFINGEIIHVNGGQRCI